MKKFFACAVIALVMNACGGAPEENKSTPASNAEPEATQAPATATTTADKDGKALIEASDCRTCHKDTEKLIGPSYAEVAAKYEATDAVIDTLAAHVINGQVGVWGQVPMTAHPQLSQEDARAMVKFILSLK
jgi:cytochrome c